MRYRSFTAAGLSCSAVTLSIPEGLAAPQAQKLACAALECGINAVMAPLGDLAAAKALAVILESVERRMMVILLRGAVHGANLETEVGRTLHAAGLSFADAFLADRPAPGDLQPADHLALEKLRASRRATRVGLIAEGEAADHHLSRFAFDVLATPYSLRSGWPERNRIKTAVERGMTVLGYGFDVEAARELKAEHAPKGLKRLFHRPTQGVAHAYDFLTRTPGWTAGQLTLGYALTEPALASVIVKTADPAELEALAAAVERELPSGAAAQIEIARFAA